MPERDAGHQPERPAMGQPTTADTGATPPATAPTTTDPAKTDPTPVADDLGEAGRRLLAEERVARKELEKQLKELRDRDPVKAIADALGVKPNTGSEDLAATVKQLQEQMRSAEQRAARLEVAAAKGLTPAQAERLRGATREEMEADADALRELFPTAPAATPPSGVPAPDPSQGPRGGSNDLQALIAAAQAKGDVMETIRLKSRLLPSNQ